uniref:YdeI/OmpD-associated family protein n=1 Tax=Lysinibacillus sp. FSL K6-3209 TaxID=2921497 RepID=UPI00403EFEC2
MVPLLRAILIENPNDVAFYDALRPGYQKDWARYIYSAIKQETRLARLADCVKSQGLVLRRRNTTEKANG